MEEVLIENDVADLLKRSPKFVKHYLLRRVLGQGRRRRVLRRQLEMDSHLVCSQLLLVDKDHVALLARLETLVDGLDVVEEVVAPLERFVTALAVEYPLAVDRLRFDEKRENVVSAAMEIKCHSTYVKGQSSI